MDIVKIIAIVILVALGAVIIAGAVSNLGDGASFGRTAFTDLREPLQPTYGAAAEWGPFSVFTELTFAALAPTTDGWGGVSFEDIRSYAFVLAGVIVSLFLLVMAIKYLA